jgi:transposase InsO family protein
MNNLPLASGHWAYLCAYQDMVSKQVMGWHVMATMPEELITTALQRACWAQPPTPGLLRPLRLGWAVLRQRVTATATRPLGATLAEPPRRLLR